ncbi:hypothetical protein D3C78_1948390 [compost metagenome]
MPDWMCGSEAGRLSNMTGRCPPSKSFRPCALPLYGMCCMPAPVSWSNITPARCMDVPVPGVPKAVPGCCLA